MSYCSETEPQWKAAEEETLAVVQHGIRAPRYKENSCISSAIIHYLANTKNTFIPFSEF